MVRSVRPEPPQIGTATGSGTVSPSGAINFNLVAKLSSSNMVGGAVNSGVNSGENAVSNHVSGALGGFFGTKPGAAAASTGAANRGIPITITGTTTSPSIANVVGMLK